MGTVTDKIYKEIKSRNLNITEFANAIGLSRDTIYNLSDETIKYATIKKIAAVLKLPISFFINDETEEKQKNLKTGIKKDTVTELLEKQTRLLNELKSINTDLKQELNKSKKKSK